MSIDLLVKKIKEKANPSVAGLDPVLSYVPQYMREQAYKEYGKNLKGACEAIWQFNKGLIDAFYDVVPAVKPQSAFYEMYGLEGEAVLHKTIEYAKEKGLYIILDVKRNDIGSTAQAYSKAYLGSVDIDGITAEPCPVDSVTVNPYLGTDGIKPFVDDCKALDKAIFTLVKTSNPSSGELQDLTAGDKKIYEHVAEIVNEWIKDTIGESGYGAQGGGAMGVKPCFNDDGLGAIVNSSRGIMCAYKNGDWKEEQFAEAARAEALRMKDDITSVL